MTGPLAPGTRVRLVSTNDPHTRLRPGVEGTVTSHRSPEWSRIAAEESLGVRWDDGSTLSLLPDEGDRWEVLS